MFAVRLIRSRRHRGSALLETALMMLVIITVIFWVFELSWLFYTYTVLADAANEGVRHAIITSGGDSTGTQDVVKKFAKASMHNVSAISVSVTFPDGSATPPNKVRVTVSYNYLPYLPSFLGSSPTMSAYAEGTMVVQ